MGELVSVIVPVYNAENYLEHCLDSLTKQSYRDVEILLVNDGSTDKSGEICDAYALKHQNIRVFHQENAGVSSARNLALKHAFGTFVMFVDSDDWIDLDTIEHGIDVMKDADADLLTFGLKLEINHRPIIQSQWGPSIEKRVILQEDLFKELLYGKNVGGYMCNKIYKKTLITGGFDPNFHICEDFEFNVRCARNVDRAVVLNWFPYHYFRAEHGSTEYRRKFSQRELTGALAYEKIIESYQKCAPECVDTLSTNQLKRFLNFRSRYKYNRITDIEAKEFIESGIKRYWHAVMWNHQVPLQKKIDIILTMCCPRVTLLVKTYISGRKKGDVL